MSYVLNLDGTVDKGKEKDVPFKEIVQKMSPYSNNDLSSYLGKYKKEKSFSYKTSLGIADANNDNTQSSAENTLIMDAAGNDVSDYEYYRNFNTVFDKEENNNIFATELEIANGSSLLTSFLDFIPADGSEELLKKLSISLDIILQAIAYITIAEVILFIKLDNLSKTSDSIEEKYHLQFGEYYRVDYDVATSYILKTLNYPKAKMELGILGVDERIAAYLIGLSEFVNPDKLINWNKLSRLDRDKNLGRKEREKYSVVPGADRLDMSNLLWATIIYAIETVTSLSTTGMNRLYMLVRKFENESIWNSDEKLYKAKIKKQNEFGTKYYANEYDKYLADMNYYYFKFVVERMHIGLKLIRRHQYNMMRDVKENGRNRVGLSKSGDKAVLSVTNFDDENAFANETYIWTNKNTGSENSQSTRLRSLPQSFIMPHSFIRSMIINNQIGDTNEFKISLGGDQSITQNFAVTDNKRLSAELVKQLEKHLDKEYMPFYLHDTRTNEIISLHAFIESITDSFTQATNPQSGFGRMDDVHHTTKTTRAIGINFFVVSTSKEDHDLMWYQINKLVAMCYPQWSKGYKLDPKDPSSTAYPFSQVPTASPLVRIRLGDLIKSNYTKQNVSRLYSAENALKDADINEIEDFTDDLLYGGESKEKITSFLIPGIYKYTHSLETQTILSPTASDQYINLNEYAEISSIEKSVDTVTVMIENPATSNTIRITADSYCIVEKNTAAFKMDDEKFKTRLTNAKKVYFNTEDEGAVNPIIAGYESALGKGLAGFITNLSIDYGVDFPWEIDNGSKAPKMLKVTIAFAPIHDIPLGLDSDGMLRAPAYNVGEVNNSLFGTVYKNHNQIKKSE